MPFKHQRFQKRFQLTELKNAIVMTMVFTLFGCSATEIRPAQTPSPQEEFQGDISSVQNLTERVNLALKLKTDTEINVFLRDIAVKLSTQSAVLTGVPVGVLVFEDKSRLYRNLAVPGNRVYLSKLNLKAAEFESELAANISFELGLLINRVLIKRETVKIRTAESNSEGLSLAKTDLFGPAGLFSFSDADYVAAVAPAIQLLQSAQYDTRALVSWFEKVETKNKGHDAIDQSTFEKLKIRAREEIALRVPIRNPIMKSERFQQLKKRIEKL